MPPRDLPRFPFPPSLLATDESSSLWQALHSRPMKAIRLRPLETTEHPGSNSLPFPTTAVPWYRHGWFTPQTPQPGRFLLHAAGGYFIQDAGSMLALALLDPQPDEVIADLCASPGGKASAILETVGRGAGFLLANEPIAGRLAALEWNLARTGVPRYAITRDDVAALAKHLAGSFDAVLVDAPCTGQTLIGRGKHSIAGAFHEKSIEHAAGRQKRILRAAAGITAPGGRLVYSTCTLNPQENEEVVLDFLAAHPSWSVEPKPTLEAWKSPLEPGGYRLWPHRDPCAGAYAILMRHQGEDREDNGEPWSMLPVSSAEQLPEPVRAAGTLANSHIWQQGRQWFAWPSRVPRWLKRLSTLGVEIIGPEIAFQKAKSIQPAHALAVRRDCNWSAAHSVELTDTEAQSYFRGETLAAAARGWAQVSWRGHPLGWIHSNDLRANNHLPTAGRISYAAEIGSAMNR